MRKSLLFIPANQPGMLQNVDIFQADGIIFDLEDAVHLTEKDAARDLLQSFFNSVELKNMEAIVRIHHLDDIPAIINPRLDTICLPKADLEGLKKLNRILTTYERKYRLSKKIGVIALIETPESILNALAIAKAPRVNGILLGGEDLSTSLHVMRTVEGKEIEFARNMVIYAAKSVEIDAIDTPFTNVEDNKGLETDILHAKALGMNAKACIHPNQIELVNRLFMPSLTEIEFAKKVVLAMKDAEKQGLGAFTVDGKMVDQPVITRALQVLNASEGYEHD